MLPRHCLAERRCTAMAKDSSSFEVPIRGDYYVVGIGEAPDQPGAIEADAVALHSLRAEFIEKWNQPSKFFESKLTAEEIEDMGELLIRGVEVASDEA